VHQHVHKCNAGVSICEVGCKMRVQDANTITKKEEKTTFVTTDTK